jgi:hypothetical protein
MSWTFGPDASSDAHLTDLGSEGMRSVVSRVSLHFDEGESGETEL